VGASTCWMTLETCGFTGTSWKWRDFFWRKEHYVRKTEVKTESTLLAPWTNGSVAERKLRMEGSVALMMFCMVDASDEASSAYVR